MSPFVRKVRTASGATAVQIVAKEHGGRRIVEHLGSAHDEAELAVLVRAGRDRITALSGQTALDLESLGAGASVAGAVVDSKRCALLWDALSGAYERLGLGEAVGGDEGFKQMALARCVERDESLRDEPVWDPATHPGSWRAVWVYSAKRFARDSKMLTAQENRARAVVADRRRPRGTRFVTARQGDQVVDEAALARARRMAGLKGYVSNIPAGVMGADEVIASYHELWHVEQSFRMSKHDLRTRPIFHRTRDAIKAHLTVVMASLAVARHLQQATGMSIKRLVRELRPLQEVTINVNGHRLTAQPQLTETAQQILSNLGPGH